MKTKPTKLVIKTKNKCTKPKAKTIKPKLTGEKRIAGRVRSVGNPEFPTGDTFNAGNQEVHSVH